MSELRAAADEAKKLVKMLSSVKVISDTFEEIANIESLTNEINGRLAEAKKFEAEAVAVRERLINEGEVIKSNARLEASDIIAKANEIAERSVEKAMEAEAAMLAAKKMASAIKGDSISAESKAKQALKLIEGEIFAKSAELNELNAKISDAQEAIKKILS